MRSGCKRLVEVVTCSGCGGLTASHLALEPHNSMSSLPTDQSTPTDQPLQRHDLQQSLARALAQLESLQERGEDLKAALEGARTEVRRLQASLTPSSSTPEGVPDTSDWSWPDHVKNVWTEAPREWQDLYVHYCDTENAKAVRSQANIPLFPFPGHQPAMAYLAETLDRIFVRESYEELLVRILKLMQRRPEAGVVVTGQPGIGKTIFLWFALLKIIGLGQPVVIGWQPDEFYLFYGGKVYVPKLLTPFKFSLLPQGAKPLWALIDAAAGLTAGNLMNRKIFPVFASSPAPNRYREWIKQRGGLSWGLPLWSLEELVTGFKLYKRYNEFHALVVATLAKTALPTDTTHTCLSYVNDALTMISNLRESAAEPLAAAEHPADTVIQAAVELAVEQVGFIPRDVNRILWRRRHVSDAAYVESFDNIIDLVSAMNAGGIPAMTTSHRITSITPTADHPQLDDDQFLVAFKSVSIEQQLADAWGEAYRLFSTCQEYPAAASLMADWAFETISHRYLYQGPPETLELYKMKSDGGDTPKYTIDTTPPRAPSFLPVRHRREAVVLNFSDPLLDVVDGNYNMPIKSSNPFFDALFVDVASGDDGGDRRVTVWVLQMTTADEAQGSSRGYVLIRNAMRAARSSTEARKQGDAKRFKVDPSVQVNYVLICPDDGKQRTWQMPSGWTENTTVADHRGDVYCVRIPMTVLKA
ncbi:hypothetical protein FA95DRAFT_127244 [Auriscalpium vulgare]|uniref:Uncharacterized protein n=1 Tax=Auriscalpium vulgare TaxID=40419 RepID=A0ACB8RMG9_9AGAM|nr:hypothetical protein FA95DRAFT_127244 [Auriscalpium vulgare]